MDRAWLGRGCGGPWGVVMMMTMNQGSLEWLLLDLKGRCGDGRRVLYEGGRVLGFV